MGRAQAFLSAPEYDRVFGHVRRASPLEYAERSDPAPEACRRLQVSTSPHSAESTSVVSNFCQQKPTVLYWKLQARIRSRARGSKRLLAQRNRAQFEAAS